MLRLIPLFLLLAACERADNQPGPMSPGEAQAIEDAAAMLEERDAPKDSAPAPPPEGKQ